MDDFEASPYCEFPLITGLSRRYADHMSGGDDGAKFCAGSLKMAYVNGAVATLARVCSVIKYSNRPGGLSREQTLLLLSMIGDVERTLPQEADTGCINGNDKVGNGNAGVPIIFNDDDASVTDLT